MNIIAFLCVKIITLLAIWIPDYEINIKRVLTVIYICKFIVDYDISRPGHSGRIYKLTKHMDFQKGEIFVSVISLLPTLALAIVAVVSKSWIPAICGGISLVFVMIDLVSNITDAIQRKR